MLARSLASLESSGYCVKTRDECGHVRSRLLYYFVAFPIVGQGIMDERWSGGKGVGSHINGGSDLDPHFVDHWSALLINRRSSWRVASLLT